VGTSLEDLQWSLKSYRKFVVGGKMKKREKYYQQLHRANIGTLSYNEK
jgi:hypothetical protein